MDLDHGRTGMGPFLPKDRHSAFGGVVGRTAALDVRLVMRHVGTTVTIITTHDGRQSYGMVATAMMSLSMEPPALAIGINHSASIHKPLLERRAFCVNILSRHDEDISRRFTKLSGSARFSAGDWCADEIGAFQDIPYLATAQAVLCCTQNTSMDYGTHCLIVGSVNRAINNAVDDPLLYCDGSYGQFCKTALDEPLALDDRLALFRL
jgi:flavin reductase